MSPFYHRFNFTFSYRPGSKNAKPDALSRLPDPESSCENPFYILPPSCVVGAITWGVERRGQEANANLQVPAGCPPNRLFVPVSLCCQCIHCAHTSQIFCYPWTNHLRYQATLLVVVHGEGGGGLCGRLRGVDNKVSQRPPLGILHPLPVPHRPWSDISLEFVTGMSPSDGNTTILHPHCGDRFSKMAHSSVQASLLPCVSSPWLPQKYGVQPESPVCVPLLEFILLSAWGHSQSLHQVPSSGLQEVETGLCCLAHQPSGASTSYW